MNIENQPLQDSGRLDLSFTPAPVAACAVEQFKHNSPQDYSFGGKTVQYCTSSGGYFG
jgi:hypothetical protein